MDDRQRVSNYMYFNCYGFRKARTRHEICKDLQMEDRHFRKIAQDLKLTNDIASLSSIGYFFIPLVTNDSQEIDAVRHSILEDYSRAHKQLKEARTRMSNFRVRFGKEQQEEFEHMEKNNVYL